MEEMAISKFKSECLDVVERVRRTRKPTRITKRGKAVVEVVPLPKAIVRGSWLDSLAGTAVIKGDIVGPVSDEDDWDALRG